jgi:hypothetical protein
MKLIRYGPIGQEKPGIVDSNRNMRDLSGEIADVSGEDLLQPTLDRLRKVELNSLPLITGRPRIGACVGRVPELPYKDCTCALGCRCYVSPDLGI